MTYNRGQPFLSNRDYHVTTSPPWDSRWYQKCKPAYNIGWWQYWPVAPPALDQSGFCPMLSIHPSWGHRGRGFCRACQRTWQSFSRWAIRCVETTFFPRPFRRQPPVCCIHSHWWWIYWLPRCWLDRDQQPNQRGKKSKIVSSISRPFNYLGSSKDGTDVCKEPLGRIKSVDADWIVRLQTQSNKGLGAGNNLFVVLVIAPLDPLAFPLDR